MSVLRLKANSIANLHKFLFMDKVGDGIETFRAVCLELMKEAKALS